MNQGKLNSHFSARNKKFITIKDGRFLTQTIKVESETI